MRSKATGFILVLVLLPLVAGAGLNVNIRSSCQADEEAMISLNSTSGGHVAEPGYFRNQVCVSGAEEFTVRQGCERQETRVLSLFDRENSHLSMFSIYSYDICSHGVAGVVRNSCFDNETRAFSVRSSNNSHAASLGYFSRELCIYKKPPENITLTLSGLSGTFYADGSTIAQGENRSFVEYPYIVAEDAGVTGIVSYGDFIRLSHPAPDTVSVTQSGSSFLLPHTRDTHREIEDEQSAILNRNFLNLLSPSFSYIIPEEPMVKVILQPGVNMTGFPESHENSIELAVRNTGLQDGDQIVDLRAD